MSRRSSVGSCVGPVASAGAGARRWLGPDGARWGTSVVGRPEHSRNRWCARALTRSPPVHGRIVGLGRGRPTAGILRANPQGTLDRQAQQKTAAPTAGTLSSRRVLALDGPDRLTRSTAPAQRPPRCRAGAARPASSQSPCRWRPTPTVIVPPHGVPAGRRQDSCRYPTTGAQRASSHRSAAPRRVRRSSHSSSPSAGSSGQPDTRCRRSSVKVVIVVGPVEGEHRALQGARPSRTPPSPARTAPPSRRSSAPTPRGPRSRPPPRARTSSSTSATATGIPARTAPSTPTARTASGLNRVVRQRQQQRQVLRRDVRRAASTWRRTPWSCSTTCATRRATPSRAGPCPSKSDRDEAGRRLRHRASCGPAPRRSSPPGTAACIVGSSAHLLTTNLTVGQIFKADPAWTGTRDFTFASGERTRGHGLDGSRTPRRAATTTRWSASPPSPPRRCAPADPSRPAHARRPGAPERRAFRFAARSRTAEAPVGTVVLPGPGMLWCAAVR